MLQLDGNLLLGASGGCADETILGNQNLHFLPGYHHSNVSLLAGPVQSRQYHIFSRCLFPHNPSGFPNAALTATQFGDFPLIVIQDNVEILCGEDGSSANNCVFTSGLIQFITLASLPQFGLPSVTTNNFRLSGFTFTGTLTSVPTIDAQPMGFSAPGTNMIVEDCHFTDMTTRDIFSVGSNALSVTPANSVEVTIKDCTFTNIDYNDSSAIGCGDEQSLTIVNTTFSNVQYVEGLGGADCDCDSVIFILCSGGATCNIQDSCFDDISFGTTLIHENNGTSVMTDNLYLGPGGITLWPSNRTFFCDQGFSDNSVPDNGVFESCTSPFTADFCSVTGPLPTISPTSTTAEAMTDVPASTPTSAASPIQSSGLVVAVMVASLVALL